MMYHDWVTPPRRTDDPPPTTDEALAALIRVVKEMSAHMMAMHRRIDVLESIVQEIILEEGDPDAYH